MTPSAYCNIDGKLSILALNKVGQHLARDTGLSQLDAEDVERAGSSIVILTVGFSDFDVTKAGLVLSDLKGKACLSRSYITK